jgi:hypothetical protein
MTNILTFLASSPLCVPFPGDPGFWGAPESEIDLLFCSICIGTCHPGMNKMPLLRNPDHFRVYVTFGTMRTKGGNRSVWSDVSERDAGGAVVTAIWSRGHAASPRRPTEKEGFEPSTEVNPL